MRMHGAADLGDRRLERHAEADLGDQLRRATADDPGSDDLSVAPIDDELDEPFGRADCDRLAERSEGEAADLDLEPLLFRARLREADPRDLGLAIDAGGDALEIDRALAPAGEDLDACNSFGGGLVGQERPADEIADREHALRTGAVRLVDDDEATFRPHAGLFEAEAGGERTPPDRDEHLFDRDHVRLFARAKREGHAFRAPTTRLVSGPREDLHLPLAEDALELVRELAIGSGQELIHHLDDG